MKILLNICDEIQLKMQILHIIDSTSVFVHKSEDANSEFEVTLGILYTTNKTNWKCKLEYVNI